MFIRGDAADSLGAATSENSKRRMATMQGVGLSQKHIDAIFSCHRRGLSIRQTAAELNIPTGTVSGYWPKISNKAPWSFDKVLERLKTVPATVEEIAQLTGTSKRVAKTWLEEQKERGSNLLDAGGKWEITKQTPVGQGVPHEIISRPDDTFVFGVSSDQHMGSKYERLDVLNDLYDEFVESGAEVVLNAGNWIDGEAKFNKFDLSIHGMAKQLDYLVTNYPRRNGLETLAISGDDHEGWYGQREGIDIGTYAQRSFTDGGRDDFKHLGFIEASVRLVNANSGKSSHLALMHP